MNEEIVYMLESFVRDGSDFLFRDNHGTVVRCEDCKYWNGSTYECCQLPGEWRYDDFCSRGKRGDAE